MIDLIATVRSTGKNSMGKVEIIGRPVRVVKRPCNIQNTVETIGNGVFVALEIFAVNLSRHKSLLESHGISDTIISVNVNSMNYI